MITRRHAIKLGLDGLAALLASAPLMAGCGRKTGLVHPRSIPVTGSESTAVRLDWLSFIESLSVMAQAQRAPDWDQDRYVGQVIDLMRRLDLGDPDVTGFYDDYVNAKGLFPEISSVHHGGHFAVATLEFDKGDRIRLHNHPDMTGVILCVSGAVEVEAYDLLDHKSDQGNLLLEQVAQERLGPGGFATLTSSKGNIHGLVATEYTELLDVFTPPYDPERLKRYRWYRRAEQPLVQGGRIFEGWER